VIKASFEHISNTLGAIKAEREATRRMLLEVGMRIANQAKALAPVDYGQLRNSLSVTSKKGENLLLNDDGPSTKPLKHTPEKTAEALNRRGLTGNEVYVGTNVEHAVHMEYGTTTAKAQPFLRPSVDIIVKGRDAEEVMKELNDEEMDKL
jgi:HK97 gp10 family phage protein